MADNALPRVVCAYTVPFHDLDPMQVMWHGNYFKYFDRTRFALFATRGIDLFAYSQSRNIIFPITRSQVKHIQPLRYNDAFECTAVITEAWYKIGISFEIRLAGGDRAVCTRATSEQVAVHLPDMELALEIPDDIRRALSGDAALERA